MHRALLLIFCLVSKTQVLAGDYTFRASTVTGRTVTVQKAADSRAYVVCFLGAECPMAKLYGPRLSELAGQFRDQSVQFIGIDSNRQDSAQEVRQYVTSLKIDFPFVRDEGNVIADKFGATRTPEVFVLDEQLKLRYHGRIDDQYEPGVNRSAPKRHDLKIAIEEVLAGKTVSEPETVALGCFIGKIPSPDSQHAREIVENDITYTRHISRLLQQHCVECHRAGDIGPFAMDSFDEVVGWAETMLETIDNGRMPPWNANPDHGHFSNARHMPESDRQLFRDWMAGGMKKGSPEYLPEPIEYVDGWQLDRDPDVVVEMRNRPFTVPANGVVEYQYFVADPGLTEDTWVTAAQVIPGNRSVVHHAIVFIRPPDGRRLRGIGWLTAYVPGQRPVPLPNGYARFIPKGSKLVFQMHYTPTGIEQDDITRVGLLLGNEKDVTHEVLTVAALNQEFEIPPNKGSHVVKAKVPWLPDQGHLLGVAPHMHYRGKSFRLFQSDNEASILLDVPNYDFNWQHTYAFAEPIPTSQLDNLHFTATFDNSPNNPFNPNPEEWVTWGDQTWEEMAVAFFGVSKPRTTSRKQLSKAERKMKDEEQAQQTAEREEKISSYVDRCMEKLDTNGDGEIERDESPIVIRFFSFKRIDKHPKDGRITRAELRKAAEKRY